MTHCLCQSVVAAPPVVNNSICSLMLLIMNFCFCSRRDLLWDDTFHQCRKLLCTVSEYTVHVHTVYGVYDHNGLHLVRRMLTDLDSGRNVVDDPNSFGVVVAGQAVRDDVVLHLPRRLRACFFPIYGFAGWALQTAILLWSKRIKMKGKKNRFLFCAYSIFPPFLFILRFSHNDRKWL